MAALVGIGALAATFIPYALLAARVRAVSMSGKAAFVDANFYHAIQVRLRGIGIANLLLASALLLFRRSIIQITDHVGTDFPRFIRDLQSSAASIPLLDRLGLLVLVALAFWLRFSLLFAPMRADEAYSYIEYASHPFYVALSFYNSPNNHIFHTFLMRCSYLVFGNHTWSLRLPAFLFGLALAPAAYLAARSLYTTRSGLVAAGLIASSSALIEYSVNARGYIILCVITLLSISLAAHALRTRNWTSWLLLAVLFALGFYTNPTMLYPCGGVALWIIVCSSSSASAERLAILAGLAFALALGAILTLELYTPIFAISGPSAVMGNTWVKPEPWLSFLRHLPPSFVPTWTQWTRDVPAPIIWLLVVGFASALFFHRRHARQPIALPVAMAVCCLAWIILQRVVFFERLWLFALPIYLVVAGAGVMLIAEVFLPESLRVRSAYAAALFALAITLWVGLTGWRRQTIYLTDEGRGFQPLAAYLKNELRPGDNLIAVMACQASMQYYMLEEHIPYSYLNQPDSDQPGRKRELMVVNPITVNEKNVPMMLAYARRTDLDPAKMKLVGRFDSLELYEMYRREETSAAAP